MSNTPNNIQRKFLTELISQGAALCYWFRIPLEIMLAQACIETGWGNKIPSNNLFGLTWDGSMWDLHTNYNTWEEDSNGNRINVNRPFVSFLTQKDSIERYCKTLCYGSAYEDFRLALHNMQYKPRTLVEYDSLIDAVAKSWATDSKYANKVKSALRIVLELNRQEH